MPGADTPPECSPIVVELAGVSSERVPGVVTRDGVTFASSVTVTGLWSGDAIEVRGISAAPMGDPPLPSMPVPCGAPTNGWPHLGSSPSEDQSAALGRLIAAEPSGFAGHWPVIDPASGAEVLIVATSGDVDIVRPGVEAIYSFPLCVVHVARSTADLEAMVTEVTRPDGTQVGEIVVELNRVRVRFAYIDDKASAVLKSLGQAVFAEPLVRVVSP